MPGVDGVDAAGEGRELLLIGAPHTGKTSFLALFYLALTKRRGTRLRLAKWAGNLEYLNQIANDLMSGTEAVHTTHDEQARELDLPVEAPDGAVFRLVVPDLSGERWRDAVALRRWNQVTDTLVRQSSAKLVFLHAREIDMGATINEVHAVARSVGASDEPIAADGTHGGLPGRPPTQVQLVDLIQLTCEQRGRRPARLCFVVSAWDEASGTPGGFVEENLPLLQQYLDSNRSWLHHEIFGVSAQGGRFDQPGTREALLEQDAIDRSIVMTGDGQEIQIGGVVEWALDLD